MDREPVMDSETVMDREPVIDSGPAMDSGTFANGRPVTCIVDLFRAVDHTWTVDLL